MEIKKVYEVLGRTYAQMVENSEREDMWYQSYQKVVAERDALQKELDELKGIGCCFECENCEKKRKDDTDGKIN